MGSEHVISTVAASGAAVSYNDESPVPGVIIKQGEMFVEGVTFSGIKKFHAMLRVARGSHVSLLFCRDATVESMVGGYILRCGATSEDSASCSLAKNPREEYAFCLRCDFVGRCTFVSCLMHSHTLWCR